MSESTLSSNKPASEIQSMSVPSTVKEEQKEVKQELAASKAEEERTEREATQQPADSILDTNVLWTIGKEVASKVIDIFLSQFFRFINYFLKKVEEDFEATLPPDSKDEYEVSKSLLASIDRVMRTPEFQERLGKIITNLGQIVQPLIDEMIILMDREGEAFANTAYGVGKTVAFNAVVGLSDGIQGALALVPGVGTIIDALDILRTVLNSGTVMTIASIQAMTVFVSTILGTFDRTAQPIVQMLENLQKIFEMIANAQQIVEKGINERAQALAKSLAPIPADERKLEKKPVQEEKVQEEAQKEAQQEAQIKQAQVDVKQEEAKQQQQIKDEQQLQEVDRKIADTEAELQQARQQAARIQGQQGGSNNIDIQELSARIQRLQEQLNDYEKMRTNLTDRIKNLGGEIQKLGKQAVTDTTRKLGRKIIEGALGTIPSMQLKIKGGATTRKLRKQRHSRKKKRHHSRKSNKLIRRPKKSQRR